MIVGSIEIIQKTIQVQKAAGFQRYTEGIATVEREIISPTIGADLYDFLCANLASVDTQISTVIEILQSSITNLAFYENFDLWNAKATDSGFVRYSGEGVKDLYVGQERRLRQNLLENGYKQLDAATRIIEKYPASFPAYEREYFEGCFLQKASEFDRVFDIRGSKFLFLRTISFQREANLQHLQPVMKETYETLLAAVETDTLTAIQKTLLGYVQKASVFATLVVGGEPLQEMLSNRLYAKAGSMPSYDMRDDMGAYSDEIFDRILKNAGTNMKHALARLRKFLEANAAELGYTLPTREPGMWNIQGTDFKKTRLL